jgi:RNAse (barnase) inhibitor barstar
VTGFEFVEEPAAYRDPEALIVRLPLGIRSKRKLLAVLADKLKFPRYFGWNLDALYDCLTVAVNSAKRPIVVVHPDLPFGERSELRGSYLSLLRDVALRSDLGGSLRAVFGTRDEAAVRAATSGPC